MRQIANAPFLQPGDNQRERSYSPQPPPSSLPVLQQPTSSQTPPTQVATSNAPPVDIFGLLGQLAKAGMLPAKKEEPQAVKQEEVEVVPVKEEELKVPELRLVVKELKE